MESSIKNRTIWSIAYPIMLGNLAQTLITFTDTAFLGRVGHIALSASMMAGIYYYVFATLAWGFSMGIQIIIARRLGEGRLERIGVIFEHGLIFVLFLSGVLFLILHFWSDNLLQAIIKSPNIYKEAIEYMDYRHYGIICVCFNFLFRALYIGLSNTQVISFTTGLMAIINILLDYIFIFGHWGFPQMGISGAALASLCAEISALLFFIIYTLLKLPLKSYLLFYFHKFEGWLIKSILKLAFPTMVQKLLSIGTWFIFFIQVEHMGEEPIAISGIIRSIYMLITIPAFAFAATSNTLTSRLIGANQSQKVIPTLFKTVRLSIFIILPILLFCYLSPQLILSMYTNDFSLTHASIPSLWMVCVASIAMTVGVPLFEAISGTGNTTYALLLESIVLIIYSLSVWFFASYLNTNVEWVWSSEFIYGSSLGIISYLYLKRAHWHKKKI